MKKIIYTAVATMLFAFILTGCSEAPLEGETIETTVVSMTVPEDSKNLIDSDSLQAYTFSEDGYSVALFLACVEGTPSSVSTFTDNDYQTFVAEEKLEIQSAFSSNDKLSNGTIEIPDTYEKIKIDGQDAIKISATIKGEEATGFITMYITGNDSDSVLIYFLTQTDTANASLPNVINQMINTVKYK